MWRFRFIIDLKHTPSPIGRFRFIIYPRHAPSFNHKSQTRPSSYVLSTPLHLAIPIHHISHLLNLPLNFLRATACGPRPGRPAARLKKRVEGVEEPQDQGTRDRYSICSSLSEANYCGEGAGDQRTRGPEDQKTRGLGQPYQGPRPEPMLGKKPRALCQLVGIKHPCCEKPNRAM